MPIIGTGISMLAQREPFIGLSSNDYYYSAQKLILISPPAEGRRQRPRLHNLQKSM